MFEIIDTSGNVARQALLREANCEKPAKGPDAKDKGGARDVAIWLSVIEYLKDNLEEKVIFVTGNTRDFGDGSEFPAPMSDDLKDLRTNGWPVPDDLAEQWNWFEAGHWPTGFAAEPPTGRTTGRGGISLSLVGCWSTEFVGRLRQALGGWCADVVE